MEQYDDSDFNFSSVKPSSVRLSKWIVIPIVLAVVGIWITAMVLASHNQVTVVTVQRQLSKSTDDFYQRDCYVTANTWDDKRISGYGPSSYCTSLKKGDLVTIENGIVSK